MACLKIWDGSAWIEIGSFGDFLDHNDTPVNFTGSGLFTLRVNTGETAVEFYDLTSNASGLGASTIGIEDSAGDITATTVEGALAELAAGGGGGSTTFVGLTDTEANFTGDAGKVLRVNAGETAVEHSNIWIDNNAILLGTGSDSSLLYDGTNTVWDLQAVGSGDLFVQNGSVGIGDLTAVDAPLHVEIDDANDLGVTTLLRLTHTTPTPNPSAGIGCAIDFETVTSAGNNEVGARIRVRLVDATLGTEAFDIAFDCMFNGALQENLLISSIGGVAILNGALDMGFNIIESVSDGIGPSHAVNLSQVVLESGGTFTGDVNLSDNVLLAFGTGSDSTLTYDATNTVWDLQAVGGGGLHLSNGNLGINAAPASWMLDVASGLRTFKIGADAGVDQTRTDAANKRATFGTHHFTNAEEPAGVFFANNQTGSNALSWGGGSSLLNAVTVHEWYAGAGATTQTGTAMMRLTTAGLRLESGISGDASQILHVVGDFLMNGNQVIEDSHTLGLGTGTDSTLTYDGTNTIWNLQAAGSGHLHISNGSLGLGIIPEALLHSFRGSSGATVPSNTGIWTEHSAINHIAISGGATSTVGILMGDNADPAEQRVISDNNARSLDFWTAGVERVSIDSAGAVTFTGALAMGANKITGLANGSAAQDAVTFSQAITSSGGTLTGDLILNDSVNLFFGTGSDSQISYDGTDTLWDLQAVGGGDLHILSGNVGIGTAPTESPLDVDQTSTTAAVPVLTLDQGDLSEAFCNFIGDTAANGSASISTSNNENSNKTDAIKIELNGVTAWIRVYDAHN